MIHAAENAAVSQWRQESERTARASNASGIFAGYALAQISLEQARVYALHGNVAATEARLPDPTRSRPDWSSDGGGMVRVLVFTQDRHEVQRSLLEALAEKGQITEAFDYTQKQLGSVPRNAGWYWLGHALAGRINPTDSRVEALDDATRRRFEAGMLRAALARNDAVTTRSMLQRWPRGKVRVETIRAVVVDLTLDNETGSIANLLRIAISDDPDSIALLTIGASSALQNKDITTAMRYLSAMPQSRERDELEASAAYSLLLSNRRADAARLFDGPGERTAKRWEQVALTLDRFEWLQSYYRKIHDPWRRAERFYQLARHALRAGEVELAMRLAQTSQDISSTIKTESTRWVVHDAVAAQTINVRDLVERVDPRMVMQRLQRAISVRRDR